MDESFNYSFSLEQAKELCLFLRRNEIGCSKYLNSLEIELQNFIYNSMTIDEAESYFNEN